MHMHMTMASKKHTSEYQHRSLVQSAPEALAYLLQKLKHSWELLSFNLDDRIWSADILVRGHKLRLTSGGESIKLQQVFGNNQHRVELVQYPNHKIGLKQTASLINKKVTAGEL